MFTKDNIFCEALSRDFSTYFVKNDKLVSICDAEGIKKAGNQRTAVGSRQTEALRRNSTLDVVVHVHQVADGAYIVGDVGIAVDGVLDGAAGHGKVDHIHGLVVVQHGVDEAAGEGITAAHAVEDITSVQLKQCFVLSAHLHCNLGLGICIAHWL